MKKLITFSAFCSFLMLISCGSPNDRLSESQIKKMVKEKISAGNGDFCEHGDVKEVSNVEILFYRKEPLITETVESLDVPIESRKVTSTQYTYPVQVLVSLKCNPPSQLIVGNVNRKVANYWVIYSDHNDEDDNDEWRIIHPID